MLLVAAVLKSSGLKLYPILCQTDRETFLPHIVLLSPRNASLECSLILCHSH